MSFKNVANTDWGAVNDAMVQSAKVAEQAFAKLNDVWVKSNPVPQPDSIDAEALRKLWDKLHTGRSNVNHVQSLIDEQIRAMAYVVDDAILSNRKPIIDGEYRVLPEKRLPEGEK